MVNQDTLENLEGLILNGKWELPTAGTQGTICKIDSGEKRCLTVNVDNIDDGSEVVPNAFKSNDPGQLWERSATHIWKEYSWHCV